MNHTPVDAYGLGYPIPQKINTKQFNFTLWTDRTKAER